MNREPGAIYSIPFNGDLELLGEALCSRRVCEVYFGGGRQTHCDNFHDVFGGQEWDVLKAALTLCRRQRVRSNLLCNAWTLFFQDIGASLRMIRSLPGLDAVTLSDPIAVRVFRRAMPGLEIQASVIMNLDSVDKIESAAALGVKTITLPTRLNRDSQALGRVRDLKRRFPQLKVKLLANHQCRSNCLFSPWHYLSGSSRFFADGLPCNARYHDQTYGRRDACYDDVPAPVRPRELVKLPFIRPEDIGFYLRHAYADAFKLVYRNWSSDVLRPVYRAYFSRRYHGDLLELVRARHRKSYVCHNARFPKGFVERVTSCDKRCWRCSYCDAVARACISGTNLRAQRSRRPTTRLRV